MKYSKRLGSSSEYYPFLYSHFPHVQFPPAVSYRRLHFHSPVLFFMHSSLLPSALSPRLCFTVCTIPYLFYFPSLPPLPPAPPSVHCPLSFFMFSTFPPFLPSCLFLPFCRLPYTSFSCFLSSLFLPSFFFLPFCGFPYFFLLSSSLRSSFFPSADYPIRYLVFMFPFFSLPSFVPLPSLLWLTLPLFHVFFLRPTFLSSSLFSSCVIPYLIFRFSASLLSSLPPSLLFSLCCIIPISFSCFLPSLFPPSLPSSFSFPPYLPLSAPSHPTIYGFYALLSMYSTYLPSFFSPSFPPSPFLSFPPSALPTLPHRQKSKMYLLSLRFRKCSHLPGDDLLILNANSYRGSD